ncbi:MAG: hypothetical protein D6706_14825 [Chloroflexi bacterium]|nr:MAG: hypothetical protein D6706_14825 [Chloroflexota bacterium]
MAAPFALAQGHSYTLDWWTIDGGGGTSRNSRYTLQATIGQPDAGVMSTGRYTLAAGYWTASGRYEVYLPVVTKP